jgi:hypothetical protein
MSYKRKRREYIPEDRYDVDGTLIKNESAILKQKVWDLKKIVSLYNKPTCRHFMRLTASFYYYYSVERSSVSLRSNESGTKLLERKEIHDTRD